MPLLDPTFSSNSNPAVGVQASATHAAVTGKGHVCNTIHCTFNAGTSQSLETPIGLPTLNNIFIDSAAVAVSGFGKVIYLVVTSALTWVTSGQATWQPFVGRTSFAAVAGAATAIGAAGEPHTLVGTAQNLGAAAQTSLPAGLYRLSSSGAAELGYPDPFFGMELKFPSALTGGAATLYAEVSGTGGPAPSQISVVVRDGASGVGAVLWATQMALPSVAGQASPPIEIGGLAITGTLGNAMTVEFTAGGGPNTFETVAFTGFAT